MSDVNNQNSCTSRGQSDAQLNTDAQPDPCYDKMMAEPKDNNLLNFIATTIETMRDQMATKDDLVKIETKIERLRDQMATKEDLAALEDRMATKADLAALEDRMATKADLAALEDRMATKIDVAAIRGDVEQVQVRLDSIDRALGARMGLVEADISHLRSVLYLLVKDKPDMLRLLGQATTGESRPQG